MRLIKILHFFGKFYSHFARKNRKLLEGQKHTHVMRWMMHAKIHNATITDVSVDREEGIFIDRAILDKVGLWEGECVLVGNLGTGDRFESIVKAAALGSGSVIVSGAGARLVNKGTKLNIIGRSLSEQKVAPVIIQLDDRNRMLQNVSQQ